MVDRVPAAPQAGGSTLTPVFTGSFCSTSVDAEEAGRTQTIRRLTSPATRQPICSPISSSCGGNLGIEAVAGAGRILGVDPGARLRRTASYARGRNGAFQRRHHHGMADRLDNPWDWRFLP